MSQEKPIFLVLWKQSSKNYSHFNTFTIKNEKIYDLTLVPHPMLIQACVHYFLSNFYFSPFDSPSKLKNVFYFI